VGLASRESQNCFQIELMAVTMSSLTESSEGASKT
jgi:hypothetical protein